MTSKAEKFNGRTRPNRQMPPCHRCGGHVQNRRVADYLVISCTGCGHQINHHEPRRPVFHLGVPSSPTLPPAAHYGNTDQDLVEASYASRRIYLQQHLLAMFDAGIEVDAIKRELQHTGTDVELHLHNALTAASGIHPKKLVITAPDGRTGRVSWVDDQGRLWHRPCDGPFPLGYPRAKAIEQCRQVLWELMYIPGTVSNDRALAMLYMAELGLHTFNTDDGRKLYSFLDNLGLDDEAKKRRIAESYDRPEVGRILQQRCGLVYCWYDSKIKSGRNVRPVLQRSR